MFNITLLIQSFNFLLAYWFLARFFFKPVLNVIQHETHNELVLKNSILNCHAILKDCYFKKQQILQKNRTKFCQYMGFCATIGIKPKAKDKGLPDNDIALEEGGVSRVREAAQILANKIIAME